MADPIRVTLYNEDALTGKLELVDFITGPISQYTPIYSKTRKTWYTYRYTTVRGTLVFASAMPYDF